MKKHWPLLVALQIAVSAFHVDAGTVFYVPIPATQSDGGCGIEAVDLFHSESSQRCPRAVVHHQPWRISLGKDDFWSAVSVQVCSTDTRWIYTYGPFGSCAKGICIECQAGIRETHIKSLV
jgi:hypothetical protein